MSLQTSHPEDAGEDSVELIEPRHVSIRNAVDMTALVSASVAAALRNNVQVSKAVHTAITQNIGQYPLIKVSDDGLIKAVKAERYKNQSEGNPVTYTQHTFREDPRLVRNLGGFNHSIDGYYIFAAEPRKYVTVAAEARPAYNSWCQTPGCDRAFQAPCLVDSQNGICSSCEQPLDSLETAAVYTDQVTRLLAACHNDPLQVSRLVGAAEHLTSGALVHVIDGAGDGGIDVLRRADDSTSQWQFDKLIQVKSHDTPCGPGPVRELAGTHHHQATPGAQKVLVSTSGFTAGALRQAEIDSIICVDGDMLSEMLSDWNLNTPADLNGLCELAQFVEDRPGPLRY